MECVAVEEIDRNDAMALLAHHVDVLPLSQKGLINAHSMNSKFSIVFILAIGGFLYFWSIAPTNEELTARKKASVVLHIYLYNMPFDVILLGMFTAATALPCDARQKRRLAHLVRAGKTPQKVVLRAKIILLAGKGLSNNRIAKVMQTTRPTVLLWRRRFEQFGCPGLLKDFQRPGRKPKLSDQKVQEVIELTLHRQPESATHWSTRTLAKKTGLSHVAVQRIWKHHGLQPHRVETFKISTDNRFVEKLRDIVGLYLKPPNGPWCCQWMKKVKSKHWIVRSRACP